MELSAWLPVGSVGALIVLIIGLNQVMIQRMETRLQQQMDRMETRLQQQMDRMEARLTKQFEDLEARLNARIDSNQQELRDLLAGHTHPPSEGEARFRVPS